MTNETSAPSAAELDRLQKRLRLIGERVSIYPETGGGLIGYRFQADPDCMAGADAIDALRTQLAEAQAREAQMAAALRDARGYAALALDRPTLHNRHTLTSIIEALDRSPASPSPVLRDAVIEECAQWHEAEHAKLKPVHASLSSHLEWAAALRKLKSRPVSEREGSADTAPAPAISGEGAVTVTIIAQSDGENTPAEVVHHTLAKAYREGSIVAWSDPAPAISGAGEVADILHNAFGTHYPHSFCEYVAGLLPAPAISGGEGKPIQKPNWHSDIDAMFAGAPGPKPPPLGSNQVQHRYKPGLGGRCRECSYPESETRMHGPTSPPPLDRETDAEMVLVPREPTEAMLDAMDEWVGSHAICRRRAWLAALAAADRSAS